MYQVNGREVKYDPNEVIKCDSCGEEMPRFSGEVQNYKEKKHPEVCLHCQKKHRQSAKLERQRAMLKDGGAGPMKNTSSKSKTNFILEPFYRHELSALAFKFGQSQTEIVQRALDALVAQLPGNQQEEVRYLISMRK
ncbi:hypothetical protein FY534_03460 [Alicyclobacillus sp. TC]|uniref:hypothetical protein n=1 Tax=Alicyclobacillus sp. TC TaxID=2606450 RepID=UPI0019342AB9|nr:hypothetical protein [Alicyclobacillus sp. TC]QRF22840.1 hypothetical protein FY534_03460 [Alicyclobacillus sp. TC]